MKTKQLKYQLLTLICIHLSPVFAQQNPSTKQIDVHQAIAMGLSNNKNLLQQRGNIKIASHKEKDLALEKVPSINFSTDFSILDDIYQYESGLFHSSTHYTIPRKVYDFSLSAEIPIYEGGKLKNHEKIADLETKKQNIQLHYEERNLRMQIITAFFKVLHLQEQQQLINDKIREDNANIQQTKLLQKNGVVTNNEVLRTELQLSNHKLAFSDLDKEIAIIAEKLKPLLGIEDEITLTVKTDGLLTSDLRIAKNVGGNELALQSNELLQIQQLGLKQHDLEKKNIKANLLPTLSAGASYKFANPNFNFFPPEAYLYRNGMVGVKLAYPISNLYKNKSKLNIVNEQHHLETLKIKEEEEQTKANLFTAQKKYEQATDRIIIAKEAITQAAENYRIVKTKYANQLSLITELIDADNAYLEARSNLISLTIDQQLKYYQLQYRLGNL